MQLSTKIAYNTIIQFISKALSTILGLLAIALITRYLNPTGYGEYTTAITFLSFFAIIADMGLTLVTVQVISRPGVDEERALGNLLGLRLVSALILLSLAPLTSYLFPYPAAVRQAILIGAASFIFTALNQILVGLFQKRLRMDKVSIAEVSSRTLLLLITWLAIRFDRGLSGIIWAMVWSGALNFVLHLLFSRRFSRFHLRFEPAYWRDILQKSWPLAVTIFFNLLYLKTDTLLLSFIPRTSQIGIIAEVGLYGAAYKVIDVLITLPFMFAGIILPIMTGRWAAGLRREFGQVYQKSFDIMAIIALPMILGTQFIATRTMTLVSGADFAASGPILRVLIIAAGAVFLGTIPAHAVIAIDKQRRIIRAYIFVALSSVAGYALVIPFWGYFGAAWVTVYSEITIALASWWLVRKHTEFRLSTRTLLKALLSGLLMSLALFFFNKFINPAISWTLVVGAAVYSVCIIVCRGISLTDLKTLIKPIK